MEKIKILGIAPYQEMGLLMTDIARSYENVEGLKLYFLVQHHRLKLNLDQQVL